MAGGGRTEPGSRRRARAESAVVPLPRPAAGDRLDLVRFVPSGRSLLLAFAILTGAFAAYWGARASSVFAVQHVEVRGAPPEIARRVERATRGVVGMSLLDIDAAAIEGQVRNLPSVAAASVDRAFPHTLVVKVAPVRAVGVVRRGPKAWLVTGSNRVIRPLDPRAEPQLARLWVPRKVAVEVGRTLPAGYGPGTRVLAALGQIRLPVGAKAVRATHGDLVVVLRDGREIFLGGPSDVLVKLAAAARVLPVMDEDMAYLDVSVPERPVASTTFNSQVEVESGALSER
jgi:cell division protein FtsQ